MAGVNLRPHRGNRCGRYRDGPRHKCLLSRRKGRGSRRSKSDRDGGQFLFRGDRWRHRYEAKDNPAALGFQRV